MSRLFSRLLATIRAYGALEGASLRRKWVTDRKASPSYTVSNLCCASATLSLDFLLLSVCATWRVLRYQGANPSRWGPLEHILTPHILVLMLQAVSHKHHRSRFTSRSKITGSDSPSCSNARNCLSHLRSIGYDCQGGGNIKSRFPPGPRIHQSFVTR